LPRASGEGEAKALYQELQGHPLAGAALKALGAHPELVLATVSASRFGTSQKFYTGEVLIHFKRRPELPQTLFALREVWVRIRYTVGLPGPRLHLLDVVEEPDYFKMG
jgi:hypothetical protein